MKHYETLEITTLSMNDKDNSLLLELEVFSSEFDRESIFLSFKDTDFIDMFDNETMRKIKDNIINRLKD